VRDIRRSRSRTSVDHRILAELIGRRRDDRGESLYRRDRSHRIGFLDLGPLHMATYDCDQIASQYHISGSRGA